MNKVIISKIEMQERIDELEKRVLYLELREKEQAKKKEKLRNGLKDLMETKEVE